jgi:hypothetical protein
LTVLFDLLLPGGGCITIIILLVPTAFYRRLGRVCVPEFGLLLNAFGQLSINNLDPGDAEGQSVAGHRVGLNISNSSSSWTGRGTKKTNVNPMTSARLDLATSRV